MLGKNHSKYKAFIPLSLYSIGLCCCAVLLFVLSYCVPIGEGDILTATYPFTNSCDDIASTKKCENHYPDDDLEVLCLQGISCINKCPTSGSIGVCQKLPLTKEIVYYADYGLSSARSECTLIGETRFLEQYNPSPPFHPLHQSHSGE